MQPLESHLSALAYAIPELHVQWTDPMWRGVVQVRHDDVIHHVAMAVSDPHPILSREAYVSLIAFGQTLEHAAEWSVAEEVTTFCWVAVNALLDELEPHVSSADVCLRRAMFGGDGR